MMGSSRTVIAAVLLSVVLLSFGPVKVCAQSKVNIAETPNADEADQVTVRKAAASSEKIRIKAEQKKKRKAAMSAGQNRRLLAAAKRKARKLQRQEQRKQRKRTSKEKKVRLVEKQDEDRCSSPTNPTNGKRIHDDGLKPGAILKFECNVGYSLVGAATLECRGGAFQPLDEFPTCVRSKQATMRCPDSSKVAQPLWGKREVVSGKFVEADAQSKHSGGWTAGTTFKYSCNNFGGTKSDEQGCNGSYCLRGGTSKSPHSGTLKCDKATGLWVGGEKPNCVFQYSKDEKLQECHLKKKNHEECTTWYKTFEKHSESALKAYYGDDKALDEYIQQSTVH